MTTHIVPENYSSFEEFLRAWNLARYLGLAIEALDN